MKNEITLKDRILQIIFMIAFVWFSPAICKLLIGPYAGSFYINDFLGPFAK